MPQIINGIRITTAVIFLLTALGCSTSGSDPVIPLNTPTGNPANRTAEHNRILWGIWQVVIEQGSFEVTLEPMREISAHFNITEWLMPPVCDDCLKVQVNSFDPVLRILDADVTLRNPTHLSGHDVRGILYTNDFGHLLKNADAWTELWDIPGGQDINPFKAFAKTEPNRIFEPDVEHTENYLIYIPLPPHWNDITFAVDASWPGNCKEPYAMINFAHDTIYSVAGSSGSISIDILDWQDDVIEVLMFAPELTGTEYNMLTNAGANQWSAGIINTMGLDAGEYEFLLSAQSGNPGISKLYQYVTITISESPFPNLEDVTPPRLNFSPNDVYIEGDYSYIAGDVNGLHIFINSDPQAPEWVGWVDLPGSAAKVAVMDGYAYVLLGEEDLHIVDISYPESPSIVHTVSVAHTATDIAVSGKYAYVADPSVGLQIVDISSPESAFIINTVDFSSAAVAVSAGYAYVSAGEWLAVIDVDPPESAHEVAYVDAMGGTKSLTVSGDYLYGATLNGFKIIDISSPESAFLLNTVEDIGRSNDVAVRDGNAYIAGCNSGTYIVDVSQPGLEYLVTTVDTYGKTISVAALDGYAYAVDEHKSLRVIDADPPGSAWVVNSVDTIGDAVGVDVSDGYAYVVTTEYDACLHIVDIDPPESAYIVNTVDLVRGGADVAVDGDYAYVTGYELDGVHYYGHVYVVNINPPESAHICHDFATQGARSWCIDISGQYAYVADHSSGLQIIDINNPEAAYILNTVGSSGITSDVAVSGGYAYLVADYTLVIADVEPPESAYEVTKFPIYLWLENITASGNYVYTVSDYQGSFSIYDISQPESTHLLKIIHTGSAHNDLAVTGGYAYASRKRGGVDIIDIDPPESANVVGAVDTPGSSYDITVSDNYAYVADSSGGLRVVEMW